MQSSSTPVEGNNHPRRQYQPIAVYQPNAPLTHHPNNNRPQFTPHNNHHQVHHQQAIVQQQQARHQQALAQQQQVHHQQALVQHHQARHQQVRAQQQQLPQKQLPQQQLPQQQLPQQQLPQQQLPHQQAHAVHHQQGNDRHSLPKPSPRPSQLPVSPIHERTTPPFRPPPVQNPQQPNSQLPPLTRNMPDLYAPRRNEKHLRLLEVARKSQSEPQSQNEVINSNNNRVQQHQNSSHQSTNDHPPQKRQKAQHLQNDRNYKTSTGPSSNEPHLQNQANLPTNSSCGGKIHTTQSKFNPTPEELNQNASTLQLGSLQFTRTDDKSQTVRQRIIDQIKHQVSPSPAATDTSSNVNNGKGKNGTHFSNNSNQDRPPNQAPNQAPNLAPPKNIAKKNDVTEADRQYIESISLFKVMEHDNNSKSNNMNQGRNYTMESITDIQTILSQLDKFQQTMRQRKVNKIDVPNISPWGHDLSHEPLDVQNRKLRERVIYLEKEMGLKQSLYEDRNSPVTKLEDEIKLQQKECEENLLQLKNVCCEKLVEATSRAAEYVKDISSQQQERTKFNSILKEQVWQLKKASEDRLNCLENRYRLEASKIRKELEKKKEHDKFFNQLLIFELQSRVSSEDDAIKKNRMEKKKQLIRRLEQKILEQRSGLEGCAPSLQVTVLFMKDIHRLTGMLEYMKTNVNLFEEVDEDDDEDNFAPPPINTSTRTETNTVGKNCQDQSSARTGDGLSLFDTEIFNNISDNSSKKENSFEYLGRGNDSEQYPSKITVVAGNSDDANNHTDESTFSIANDIPDLYPMDAGIETISKYNSSSPPIEKLDRQNKQLDNTDDVRQKLIEGIQPFLNSSIPKHDSQIGGLRLHTAAQGILDVVEKSSVLDTDVSFNNPQKSIEKEVRNNLLRTQTVVDNQETTLNAHMMENADGTINKDIQEKRTESGANNVNSFAPLLNTEFMTASNSMNHTMKSLVNDGALKEMDLEKPIDNLKINGKEALSHLSEDEYFSDFSI